MRHRVLLFSSVLAIMASMGIAGGVASAATLYTSSSHVAAVPVGTTAVATAGTVVLTSGSTTVNSCTSSSLNLSLTQNSGGMVVADVTGGSFAGCRLATTVNACCARLWHVIVTGAAIIVGLNTLWNSVTARNVSVTFAGGTYTGDLTTGIVAQQPVSGGAPVSIALNNAAKLAGPLTSNGQVTGTYTLTGAAASYSLG
jgi:hypothetical protein